MKDREELTRAEQAAFAALANEIEPPDGLEDDTLRLLRQRRLVRSGGHWWHAPRPAVWGVALAACLATLIIGIGVGRASVEPELPRASFILFLHAGPEFDAFSDANFAARFEDYNRWVAETRGSGHFITGEQLDDTGVMILPDGRGGIVERRVSAGPDGDMLGMFLITAADYDEATRIAQTLPHLEYGGRVSIRRVDPV